MEIIAKPLAIAVAFVSLLMMIVYAGAAAINATETSRSSNMSDNLHQAIETVVMDVLNNHLDEDSKKDFIAVIKAQEQTFSKPYKSLEDIKKDMDKEIRDAIDGYLEAFPDVAFNTSETRQLVANCMRPAGRVNLEEAYNTYLGALRIEIHTGNATGPGNFNSGTHKYRQSEADLPKIYIYTEGSGEHPSALGGRALVGYYVPPARQTVGPTLLPMGFRVSAEIGFIKVDGTSSVDSRDKIGVTHNAQNNGKTSNAVDENINFDVGSNGSGGTGDVKTRVDLKDDGTTGSGVDQYNRSNITDSSANSAFRVGSPGW